MIFLKNEFPCYFFLQFSNIIRSHAEFTSADILLKTGIILSTNIYIYTYI
uniref:Uncharacterized protein n=1 Tax=Macaca fascicularis TaxID=9541 RepID=A0A7N9D921_MACFA